MSGTSGILASHLRESVIRPVLSRMAAVRPALASPAAEELLVGTAAQESRLGRYLRQHPTGPARGIYQMEPATTADLLRWLEARPELAALVNEWAAPAVPVSSQVSGNLYLATALARLNYWRKPFGMPASTDVEGLAHAWKVWWNTALGAGTEGEFVRNYRELAHT